MRRKEAEQHSNNEAIATVPFEEVLSDARQDKESKELASWLQKSKNRIPSEDELNQRKLTEFNYLALQTDGLVTLRSIAGGAASPLALPLLQHEAERVHAYYQGAKSITAVLLTHGTPTPRITNERSSTRSFGQREHQYLPGNDSVHNELSCGGAGGHLPGVPAASLINREQAGRNIHALREWARGKNIPMAFVVGEALVHPNSPYPQWDIFHESPTEADADPFNQSFDRRIVNANDFNDIIGLRRVTGSPMIGVGCFDRRQGLMEPHPSIPRFDIDALQQQLMSQGGHIRTDWSGREHSEPFVLPIIEDEEMQQLAAYFLKHRTAMIRRLHGQGNFLAEADPLVMNLPKAFVQEHAGQITQILTNLISRLDTDMYRTPILGRKATRVFVQSKSATKEISMNPGLQVVIPRGDIGDVLAEHVKPGRIVWDWGHPSREITLSPTVDDQGNARVTQVSRTIADFSQVKPWIPDFTRRQPGPRLDDID
jgi:hypothetical protein